MRERFACQPAPWRACAGAFRGAPTPDRAPVRCLVPGRGRSPRAGFRQSAQTTAPRGPGATAPTATPPPAAPSPWLPHSSSSPSACRRRMRLFQHVTQERLAARLVERARARGRVQGEPTERGAERLVVAERVRLEGLKAAHPLRPRGRGLARDCRSGEVALGVALAPRPSTLNPRAVSSRGRNL